MPQIEPNVARALREGEEAKGILFLLILSLVLVGLTTVSRSDVGLDLGDEGHLWYCTLQTAAGGVPIRDFRSYDPGRYLWAAGCASFLGSGIVGLRHANSLFQVLGLFLALLSARRVLRSRWGLVLVGLVLNLWFFPSFKVYEHTVAVAAIFFALRLVERPSPSRHFACGVLAGLAGFVGRNLGLYCFLATLALTLFLHFKGKGKLGTLGKRLGAGIVGTAVGYAPMLLMLLLVPGFFSSFIQSILLLFGPGSPTLPKSVAWPWMLGFPSGLDIKELHQFCSSFLFVFFPIVYLIAVVEALRTRAGALASRSLLIAATVVGLPFLHHVFARPDLGHLGQVSHPFLLALLALSSGFGLGEQRRLLPVLFAFLLMISVLVVPWQLYPIGAKIKAATTAEPSLRRSLVGHDQIWLSREKSEYLQKIKEVLSSEGGPTENIVIAPNLPGLYAVLGKTSPIWDPFPLFPTEEKLQRAMIEDLTEKNVAWALISTQRIDGMEERQFPRTHPLVWQHILDEFDVVPVAGLPPDQRLFRRR